MDIPLRIPVTTPDEEPIVATVVVPLVQVPLPVALLNVAVEPTQTDATPVIAAGELLTVTVNVDEQPVDVAVNVTIEVPLDTPAIVEVRPGEVAVATPGVPLIQVPVIGDSVSVIDDPVHIVAAPPPTTDGTPGEELTVTVAVAIFVHPAELVTE